MISNHRDTADPESVVTSGTPMRQGPHQRFLQKQSRHNNTTPPDNPSGRFTRNWVLLYFYSWSIAYDPFICRWTPSLDSRPPSDSPSPNIAINLQTTSLSRGPLQCLLRIFAWSDIATVGCCLLATPRKWRQLSTAVGSTRIFQMRAFLD